MSSELKYKAIDGTEDFSVVQVTQTSSLVIKLSLLICFALGTASFAEANPSVKANTNGIDVKLEQKLVKRADGKTIQAADANAEKTNPGDVIEYSAAYANNGQVVVKNLSGVLPIPTGVTYVAGSAKPAAVFASTDGVNFAPVPLKRKVRDANGVEKEIQVPLSEYRTLRWSLGTLAPQKQVSVSARMQLNPVAIPETAARSPSQ